MRIIDLPEDIHRHILSKIYTVEDHIIYCKALNIEYHFDICGELIYNEFDIINCYYFKVNDTQHIISYQYGNKISLGLHSTNESITYVFTEIKSKYFDGKIIEVFNVEALRIIPQYLCGALYINMEKIELKTIDDEIKTIMKNLNTNGSIFTCVPELAYDIGFFKTTLITKDYNNLHKRLFLYYKYNKPYENNNIVEYLSLYLHTECDVNLNNLLNLKVLFIYIQGCNSHGCEDCSNEINVIINNAPKLKIVKCYNRNMTININIPGVLI